MCDEDNHSKCHELQDLLMLTHAETSLVLAALESIAGKSDELCQLITGAVSILENVSHRLDQAHSLTMDYQT